MLSTNIINKYSIRSEYPINNSEFEGLCYINIFTCCKNILNTEPTQFVLDHLFSQILSSIVTKSTKSLTNKSINDSLAENSEFQLLCRENRTRISGNRTEIRIFRRLRQAKHTCSIYFETRTFTVRPNTSTPIQTQKW